MEDETEETTADDLTPLASALSEEAELSVEEQLALIEEEALRKDKKGDSKKSDDETAESEESEETVGTSGDEIPEEFKAAAQKEVDLQLKLQRAETRIQQLEAATGAEEEEEEETEYEYDVGDLDPAFEGIRESLEAMGKFYVTEQKKLERQLGDLTERLNKRDNQYAAQQVKDKYKITDPEEKKIQLWAKENELIYYDQKSLSKVVELYRNNEELVALRAGTKKADKANANPRKRTASQSTVKTDLQEEEGTTFEASWQKAVKKTNRAVASGTLR